jgi:hypothetical protein
MTFSLTPPKNITNLFGNWLQGVAKNEMKQIRVGVCAILWLYGIYKMISCLRTQELIRTWSYLQLVEQREAMDSGCNRLETVARDLFNQFG